MFRWQQALEPVSLYGLSAGILGSISAGYCSESSAEGRFHSFRVDTHHMPMPSFAGSGYALACPLPRISCDVECGNGLESTLPCLRRIWKHCSSFGAQELLARWSRDMSRRMVPKAWKVTKPLGSTAECPVRGRLRHANCWESSAKVIYVEDVLSSVPGTPSS